MDDGEIVVIWGRPHGMSVLRYVWYCCISAMRMILDPELH